MSAIAGLKMDHHTFAVTALLLGAIGGIGWFWRRREACLLRRKLAAEEALNEAGERMTGLINAAMDAIISIDERHQIVLFNPAAEKTFGYRSEEVIGRPLSILLPERFRTAHTGMVHAFGTRGETSRRMGSIAPLSCLRANGEEFPGEVSISHVKVNGRTYFTAIVRDVSQRLHAEARQERERAMMKTLVKTLPDLVWLKDPAGVYLACNPRLERLFGASEAEIVGRTDYDFVDREMADAFRQHDRAAIAAGKPSMNEEELVFADDGHHELVETVKTPMFDSQGTLIGVLGIARDITASRRAQDRLRASEKRFRDIVSSFAGWVWETDASGVCTYASERVTEVLGYTPEEMVGKTAFDLMPPDEVERVLPIISEIVRNKAPIIDFEDWKLHKDGRRVCLVATGIPLHDAQGTFLGYRGVDVDITARKMAEAALAQSEERFRTMIENASDLITVLDPQGVISFESPAMKRILGYEIGEMIGRNAFDFIDPKDAASVTQAMQACASQPGNPISVEYQFRHHDGSWRTLQSVGNGVRQEGESKFIVVNSRDITESRKLEAQLRQSQKMEAIGQLAGGVAHDFNNLLSVITGYSELVALTQPRENPIQNSMGEILHAAHSAASLTRQLLVFSRQQVLEPKVLDLNAVVTDSQKMLRRLIGEDIELTTTLSSNLRAVKVDPGQINQVIMNLSVNARDAMPQGGHLTIETKDVEFDEAHARNHPDCPLGKYVLLSITDTGCGMPPEVRSRIFEPFFTTKGISRGTGLGLSVVHGIVKQSGGSLDVYSEVGIGTTFKIYLPAVEESPARTNAHEPAQLARGGETILLVEDDEAVRRLTMAALQHLGYHVLKANSGTDALRLFDQQKQAIDLLLTDVVMPTMSGRQLADEMSKRVPNLKVLYQSGYTDDAVVRHGILQAEVAFLQKPFTLAGLAAKVREVLDRN